MNQVNPETNLHSITGIRCVGEQMCKRHVSLIQYSSRECCIFAWEVSGRQNLGLSPGIPKRSLTSWTHSRDSRHLEMRVSGASRGPLGHLPCLAQVPAHPQALLSSTIKWRYRYVLKDRGPIIARVEREGRPLPDNILILCPFLILQAKQKAILPTSKYQ